MLNLNAKRSNFMNATIFKKASNISKVILYTICIGFIDNLSISYAADIKSEDQNRIMKSHNRILQEHEREKRIIEFEKQEKESQKKAPRIHIPMQPQAKGIPGDLPCFFIDKIILESSELLHEKDKKRLLSGYIKNCLNMNDINNLVRDITNFYIKAGYPTTRVRIAPSQNLQKSTLKLIIINGFIEDIITDDATLKDRMKLFMAFPFLKEKRLCLRDIEQGIDQFNRLASNNVGIKILPGEKESRSKILIENRAEDTFKVDLSYDNSGQESTGKIKRKITMSKDNLIGINDNFTFNFMEDNENKNDIKFSKYYSAGFSFPFGYWTISGSYNYSKYMLTVHGIARPFKTSGNSNSSSFEIERLVYRDQTTKTSLSSSFTLKGAENYIKDVKTETACRKLSVLQAGVNHKTRIASGVISFDFAYYKGVKDFGAKQDPPNMTFDQPKAQFEKYGFDISYYRPFTLFKQKMVYKMNIMSQYSEDVLFGSEKFFIGDSSTVRGFKNDSVQGDSGVCFKNEFSFTIPTPQIFAGLDSFFNNTQFFLAIDTGYASETASKNANLGEDKGRLTGWASGLKYDNGWFVLDFTYSEPLSWPDFIDETDFEIYLSITFGLDNIFDSVKNNILKK